MKKFSVLILLLFGFAISSSAGEALNNFAKITLNTESALQQGKSVTVTMQLSEAANSEPVSENDLKIAHTKKIHLLAIDSTLTDFQHIHPVPTKLAGKYKFEFTPRQNDQYKFWADITPVETGRQEYDVATLGKANEQIKIDKTINNEADAGGYKFSLLFDEPLTAGKTSMGTIKIRDNNGAEVTDLEPVLGAFAHIAVFNEDLQTMVHVHPMGREPQSESDKGGPMLEFHIQPEKAGFAKMFVQVKIKGKDIFVPFGLKIGNSLALN